MSVGVVMRRCAASAAVSVAVVLAMAASPVAAEAAPIWRSAVPYGAPSSTSATIFLAVSCVSPGQCVAVGHSQPVLGTGTTALVAVESSGSWGPTVALAHLPADADASANASAVLDSVSCTSATTCVAVGDYRNAAAGTDAMEVPISVSGSSATPGQAVAVALPGMTSPGSQKAALTGVSCNSAGACTGVGFYVADSGDMVPMTATPSGATWSATEVTSVPAAAKSQIQLTALSCPPSGACEAVGQYSDVDGNQKPWAVTVTGGVAGQGVAIGLPSDFVPAHGAPFDPSGILNVLSTGLATVSCPSDGVCTMAGSYRVTKGIPSAVAVPITNGVPGTPVKLTRAGDATGSTPTAISGIWCADAADCAVGGISEPTTPGAALVRGATGSETDGTWSSLAPLDAGDGGGPPTSLLTEVTALTCASPARCVASGFTLNFGRTLTASTFFASSQPPLSVSSTTLPSAQVGVPYRATLQAGDGSGDERWSIGVGSLPAGLSLDASTGVISGTPSASGQSGFIVNVADAGPPTQTASGGVSITVSPAPATPTARNPSAPPAKRLESAPPTPTVSVTFLTTSGTKATVVLLCSGAPCAGSLKIAAVEHLKAGKATAVVGANSKTKHKAKRRTKTIRLASGRYGLAAGKAQVVRLRLSKAARRLLASLHRLSGDLTVTPHGATHPAVVKKVTFRARHRTHKKAHHKGHKKTKKTKKHPASHARALRRVLGEIGSTTDL